MIVLSNQFVVLFVIFTEVLIQRMKLFFLSLFTLLSACVISQGVTINEVVSSNYNSISDEDGDFSDWIELYNNASISIDLDGYFLSDEFDENQKWTFPSVTIQPNDFLIVFISGKNKLDITELHTNFKIKSSGERIVLSDASYLVLDNMVIPSLKSGQSYGRINDGTINLGIISNPTPGVSNNNESLLTEITFSKQSGFYDTAFELSITCTDSVFYTFDGSMPSNSSNLYTNTISISKPVSNYLSLIPTTPLEYNPDIWPNKEFGFQEPQNNIRKAVVISAVSYKNGAVSSQLYHETYFIQKKKTVFPVLSLITDSLALFDFDEGIYVPGTYLNEDNEGWTGNYFKRGIDWEKIGNVEWFDQSGKLKFSEPAGFRISGQKSRSAPQKSIRLYFRGEYGRSSLKKSIFINREYEEYKRLTLRTSFTYWWGRNTLFQDDLIHKVVSTKNFDLDVQMSRPSILFINGEYWGIHNLRERQDKYYFESIYDLDKDSIDIITGNLTAEQGSSLTFLNLLDFIEKHDLSVQSNYDHVSALMNINNFIDYNIAETFFGNGDWPANNVRMWRKQSGDTRWKWLFYDLDAAIGNVNLNPFIKLKASTAPHSKIYNALMKNEDFESAFITKYIYHLQKSFNPNATVNTLNEFKILYAPEISEHIIRWQNPNSYQNWESNCDYLENFLRNRPCFIKAILIEEFELDNLDEFNCLYQQSSSSGIIKVYPNPSLGQFTMLLDVEGEIEGTIKVVNSIGQIVYSDSFMSVVHEFDLGFLSNGMYTIYFYNNQVSATKKVIIQK